MGARIHRVAEARIHEIWDYTERNWGVRQADKYVRELVRAIHLAGGKRRLWKPLPDEELEGIFYFRHGHHYVFFRELEPGEIGVISVLHESMDLPNRLREDNEGT